MSECRRPEDGKRLTRENPRRAFPPIRRWSRWLPLARPSPSRRFRNDHPAMTVQRLPWELTLRSSSSRILRVWSRIVESMSSSSSAAVAKRLERPEVSASSSKLFQSSTKHTLPLCLLLTVVVLVFYNPVIHNGFLNYDDDQYITQNPHVWAGLTWATVKWSFSTYQLANWHPLTWLSHALDCD